MVLNWIADFLSNRKQRVVVHGTFSEWSQVTGGVPQDSVLGPTLFIIYVNDLPDCVQSYMGIFADDTKIYRPIISPTDYNILQSDINSVLQWCDIWLSFLNYSKCHYNSIGPALSDRQYYLYTDDDTHPISFVLIEKDLGLRLIKI